MPKEPPHTISVAISQLGTGLPDGRLWRRFTHSGGESLVPAGTPRCLEIVTPPNIATPPEALDRRVARLVVTLKAIPGVSRVNVLRCYVTIEGRWDTSWGEIINRTTEAIGRHLGWPQDYTIREQVKTPS